MAAAVYRDAGLAVGHCAVVFFEREEHINLLETRALLNHLRRRATDHTGHWSRFLRILDSQVAQSVSAKGRSSSFQLNRILRRITGVVLAAALFPFYAWTRSELNPSDAPSRSLL